MNTPASLISFPAGLHDHWANTQSQLSHDFEQRGESWPNYFARLNTQQQADLKRVLSISQFSAHSLPLEGDYFFQNIIDNRLYQTCNPEQLKRQFSEIIKQHSRNEQPSEAELFKALRVFRRRTQVQIIFRDLLRLATTMETTRMLSDMADVCISVALEYLHGALAEKHGHPIGKESRQPQRLLVLGMGKLGAHELNLSSDIDLIFCYPESGMTQGATQDTIQNKTQRRREISNQEFFIKLGQKLIQALDNTTLDGFVFRTDMRLRPYGDSGPLVMNFASMEGYYQQQGRDWERYAMVKARIVSHEANSCESSEAGCALLAILRPFTYRRYVDFSAFESLRSMKAMINTEVRRRGLHNNIKLGGGGIREVEFIVQAFQLIRGGQEKELQERSLLKVLNILEASGYLPAQACTELRAAYVFLRDVEHGIQALNDEQTQRLPNGDDERRLCAQSRLALAMNHESWESLMVTLSQHRHTVSHHFAAIVSASSEEESEGEDNETRDQADDEFWQALWLGQLDADDPHFDALLAQHPCADSAPVIERLKQFRDARPVQAMQSIGRERLDRLMPLLLKKIWQQTHPVTTLERIIPLIEAVARRTIYLVLLSENPQALRQLVRLCSASPWLAKAISQAPILLDELLDPRQFYSLPSKRDLATELQQRLLRIEPDDLEQQMDQLRHFANAHKLRAGANEVQGSLSLMKISDYLTHLAEVLLDQIMQLAFQQMVSKYGYPCDVQDEEVLSAEFMVVGYGKMGGVELSYGSDLDLVFLYDTAKGKSTSGARALDNGVFYTRMGQRMIHILSANTRAGSLYEVDMRLRPSGASGMIATSLTAFDNYQRHNAWTWEHQALVRARVVSGDEAIRQQFQRLRHDILAQPRENHALSEEVRAMRDKMRDNLGSKNSSDLRFHLKHDEGGIVDIEFMVQYGVLNWAHTHPELSQVTDNMRLLDAFAQAGLMSPQDAQTLQAIYLAYRAETHRRALQNEALHIDSDTLFQLGFSDHINAVSRLWRLWLNR